jgi:hypothetical protein
MGARISQAATAPAKIRAGWPSRYQAERFAPFVATGRTRTFFMMTGVQLTAVPGGRRTGSGPAGEAFPASPRPRDPAALSAITAA